MSIARLCARNLTKLVMLTKWRNLISWEMELLSIIKTTGKNSHSKNSRVMHPTTLIYKDQQWRRLFTFFPVLLPPFQDYWQHASYLVLRGRRWNKQILLDRISHWLSCVWRWTSTRCLCDKCKLLLFFALGQSVTCTPVFHSLQLVSLSSG